jgi:endonuclease III
VDDDAVVRDLVWRGRYDLIRTFAPLVRGQGDRTIRLSSTRLRWTTRTPDGPASVEIRSIDDGFRVLGWGPGGPTLLDRAERLLGIDDGGHGVAMIDAPDGSVVARLARRFPGVRLTRTEAVLDALVPAILEQKVTGTEAHRAWNGLVRMLGEPAPGPPGRDGLRLPPAPSTLARLPDHAFHRIGVEGRRAALIRRVAREADRLEATTGSGSAAGSSVLDAIPGVGPWTVAEVALRAWGDPDAVSVGDFHLKHLVGFALAGEPRADDARMLELLAPYAGRRALVIRVLELGGPRPPRYGPRLAPRDIRGM